LLSCSPPHLLQAQTPTSTPTPAPTPTPRITAWTTFTPTRRRQPPLSRPPPPPPTPKPRRTGAPSTTAKRAPQSGKQTCQRHGASKSPSILIPIPILTLPISPTEQRPASTAARIFQEPQFRRQHVPKADAALHTSALSSGAHNAPHSTTQARQDSAIDHHRFDTANSAQLTKPNVSYSQQSPKDSHQELSPRFNPHHPTPSTQAFAPVTAPHQADTLPAQSGTPHLAHQHARSLSSGNPYSVPTSRSHELNTERTSPVDIKIGADVKPNHTGSTSLPEHVHGHQNSNGTRQQRYNVRFAANYTSENMPPSQKPRNDPPTPTAAPAVTAEPEQTESSPAPVTTTEECSTMTSNGTTHHTEAQPRTTKDVRDRGDREPSVERCLGCNEPWRRPIPDLDSRHISPAETNAEFMKIASNMIDRLRDQRKKADAAYDEWRWRHSHCNYRPTSPSTVESLDDAHRRTDAGIQFDGSMNSTSSHKRKSEIPHEPHSASKQRRVSPAPPVRNPDLS
jgi:hypothetical protein